MSLLSFLGHERKPDKKTRKLDNNLSWGGILSLIHQHWSCGVINMKCFSCGLQDVSHGGSTVSLMTSKMYISTNKYQPPNLATWILCLLIPIIRPCKCPKPQFILNIFSFSYSTAHTYHTRIHILDRKNVVLCLNFSTNVTFMDECPARLPDLGIVPEISGTLMRGLEWAGSSCLAERWWFRLLETNPTFLNPPSVCCHIAMPPFALLGLFQRFAHSPLDLAPVLTIHSMHLLFSFILQKLFLECWTCFQLNHFPPAEWFYTGT